VTFDTIVQTVMDRMNLSSPEARTRIGQEVNVRWRRLTVECGIKCIAKTTATATTAIGNRYLTFGPTPQSVIKVLSVFNTAFNPYMILTEFSFTELRNQIPGNDPPDKWAMSNMLNQSVEIFLSTTPSTNFVLTADVIGLVPTLSGSDVPALTENFIDLLIYAAMAEEYDKMEKTDLAAKKEQQYEDLKGKFALHIAVSAYKDITQGKDNFINPWWSQPVV
jgi:hypothetical protein